MTPRIAAAALAASALLLPSAALAGNGHGKSAEKHVKKEKPAKSVAFNFRGTFTAPGTVTVTAGNAHVRKGGFVGQSVPVDLSTAKIVVDDVNGDGAHDLADVADGDVVKVRARAPKGTKLADGETAAFAARKLIDRTAGEQPESDEPESGEPGDDAVVAPPAP